MSSHGGAAADASPYLGSILPVIMWQWTSPELVSHRVGCARQRPIHEFRRNLGPVVVWTWVGDPDRMQDVSERIEAGRPMGRRQRCASGCCRAAY